MKKIKKVKNALLPGTFFFASFYFSILFLFGIIFGYWATNKFCKKYIDSGKINSIYLNFGAWNFHFHHWLMGSLGLFFVWFLNGFYNVPQIVFGALGGLIFHDLHTDKVWHKVIYKKDGK